MNKTVMTKSVDFTLLYYYSEEHLLSPKPMNIQISMYGEVPLGADDAAVLQLEYNVSYAKILTIIEGVIADSILATAEDYNNNHELLDSFSNNLIMLPIMSESILTAALYSKFNSIVHENTQIESVSITDCELNVTYTHTDLEVNENVLPTTEYFGEFPLWEQPWWLRNDALTFDGCANSAEEQAEYREYVTTHADTANILNTIDQQIREVYNHESPSSPVTGKDGDVIQVDFKKNKDKTVH